MPRRKQYAMTIAALPVAGAPRNDRIVTTDGRPPQYVILPRKRIFQFKLEVDLLDDFYYWTGPRHRMHQLHIPAGKYDGFSVPWYARVMSGGQLSSVMSGMAASFVHDLACKLLLEDSQWRRELFVEAYDSTMLQYFPQNDPEAWGSVIKRGVLLGSKYCAIC